MKNLIRLNLLLVFTLAGLQSHSQVFKDTIYFASNGIDAQVASAAPTTNYGTDTLMSSFWNGKVRRTFVDADLTGIPTNAIVLSTELKLYAVLVDNTVNHDMFVSRVMASWAEGTITSANQPAITTTSQVSILHATTSSTGWQTLDITALGQYAVNYPSLNHGWRVNLQTESGGSFNGVTWASGENAVSARRPYVIVEYVIPIELTATVHHCSSGIDDGRIDVTVDDGSGTYTSHSWYKYENHKSTLIQTGSGVSGVDIDSLEDGLYLCSVTDNRGTRGYKYFLVGEYGTSTTVEFRDSSNTTRYKDYMEDSQPTFAVSTSDATRIGGADITTNAFRSSTSYTSGLMKYQVDIDSMFDVTVADLRLISAIHYKNASPATTDSGYVSRVKQNWRESTVTWEVKPTVTTSQRITIDETSPSGNVTRNDTIDLLNFVQLWQEYPDSNFGIDLSLKHYSQAADASLRYFSSDWTTYSQRPSLLLTFALPEQIITNWIDSMGLGLITVNAPAGELPYTYLVSYDTLPDFDTIWYAVRDSLPPGIDSVDFYTGRSNVRNFTFEPLPANRYFIGVYDNNGQLLLNREVILTPEFEIYDSTDVDVDDDTLKVLPGRSFAIATMLAQLQLEQDGGFEIEVATLDDDLVIGLDRSSDVFPVLTRDYLYALEIKTSGKVYVHRDTLILDSITVSVGDKLKLFKDEFGIVHFYKGENEFVSDTLSDTLTADLKLHVHLKGPDAMALFTMHIHAMLKPKLKLIVNHTECGANSGSVSFKIPAGFGVTPGSLLISDQDGDPVSTGPLPGPIPLAPGLYTLSYTYTIGGSPYTWNQVFVVGYKIIWNDLANLEQVTGPFNSIKPEVGGIVAVGLSSNKADQDYENWIQFSTQCLGPDDNAFEVIAWQNQTADYPANMHIIEGPGPLLSNFVYVYDEMGALQGSGFVGGINSFRIHIETNGDVSIYYSNFLKYTFGSAVIGDLKIYSEMFENVRIDNAVASFCYPTNMYVAKTKSYTDGSYFLTTDDVLLFQYTGEYNESDLLYSLVDEAGTVISTSNYTIDVSVGSGIAKKNADNRYTLDMEALPAGFYLLTITNEKGEEHYLRVRN